MRSKRTVGCVKCNLCQRVSKMSKCRIVESAWLYTLVLLCANGCAQTSELSRDESAPEPILGVQSSLQRRMESFLAAFDTMSAPDFRGFFPRYGEVTYWHTRHTDVGDSIRSISVSATEIADSLNYPGAFWPSFQLQFEGQPLGLLVHQVYEREGTWIRVDNSRYVPPGESRESPTFIEWRREDDQWVIAAFGDESFVDVPLPPWLR